MEVEDPVPVCLLVVGIIVEFFIFYVYKEIVMKIKGLLASAFLCVFFQPNKKSSSFASRNFLIILFFTFSMLPAVM